MYRDAEKRKKELMAKNEMNGLMFKIEADRGSLEAVRTAPDTDWAGSSAKHRWMNFHSSGTCSKAI